MPIVSELKALTFKQWIVILLIILIFLAVLLSNPLLTIFNFLFWWVFESGGEV